MRPLKCAVAIAALLAIALGPAYAIKVALGPSTQTGNHSPDNTYVEGTAMHDVGDRLTSKLTARGFEVTNGQWQSYYTTDHNAANWGAEVCLALHSNACCSNDTGWHSTHGTQIFPYSSVSTWSSNVDLANRINSKMVAKFTALGAGSSGGVYPDTYSQFPTNTNADNILIESLFHDNYNDCQVLKSAAGKDTYAQGVFEAVCDHFGWSYTGTSPPAPANGYYGYYPFKSADGVVTVPTTGLMEVFVKGWDNRIYHAHQTAKNGGWTGWSALGNQAAGSDPVAVINLAGGIEVFVRGADNMLYHCWQTAPSSSWSDWASLGGPVAGKPAVGKTSYGSPELYTRFPDGSIQHKWCQPDGSWNGWNSLGGNVAGNPVVGIGPGLRQEVFVRGGDNQLYRKWQTPEYGWSSWENLGGTLSSDPAVGRMSSGGVELFARFTDGTLRHIWELNRSVGAPYAGWAAYSGSSQYDMAAVAYSNGTQEIYHQGLDGTIYRSSLGSGWSAWASIGGSSSCTPMVGHHDDGKPIVFTPRSDGKLYACSAEDNWATWFPIGESVFIAPSAFTAIACTGGTAAGSGNYSVGQSVTATATPDPGYQFVSWTTGGCGGAVVSTNASYTFTMPTATYVLNANFQQASYTVTTNVCTGGTATGGGLYPVNVSATVTATPASGFCFVNWTSDTCGGTAIVSRSPGYTFTVPSHPTTLYANFSHAALFEGFEGLAAGDITMNNSTGPNKATNGDKNSGNPWSGPAPPNGSVVGGPTGGVDPNTDNGMFYASAGYADSIAMANVAYRCNNGAAFTGGIFLDWWFYDPKGSASDSNTYQDYAALCFYPASVMPSNADFGTYTSPLGGATQRLSLGASSSTAAGYDRTRYQARIVGTAGYDGTGWTNLSLARSVGWHHARINVGPAKGGGTNDVKLYIDNMSSALLSADSTTNVGYNSIQLNARPGATSNTTGYLDDLTFGRAPAAPSAAASSDIGVSEITWHWAATDSVDGFSVCDSTGSVKGTTDSATTQWTETGLNANTRYYRYVSGYLTIAGGQATSASTALPGTYTLAVAPTYGMTGAGAVYCNKGPGSLTAWYPLSAPITFTAMNGFGSGPTRASKYYYVWDSSSDEPNWTGATQWTSSGLVKTSSVVGAYYLHVQACNGDGLPNPTTATQGPYDFRTYTAVSRIPLAWQLANALNIGLTNKYVTAVFPDAIFIEELDRGSAMKILFTGYAAQGHLANVYGALQLSSNPRVLATGTVQDLGPSAQVVGPLTVTTTYLGGCGFNPATPGVSYPTGLYNVGLLVKLAGNVTYCNTDDPDAKYFYLSDGGTLYNGTDHPGVQVLCGSADPPASGRVAVVGVVDTGLVGSNWVPAIRVRHPAEIVVY